MKINGAFCLADQFEITQRRIVQVETAAVMMMFDEEEPNHAVMQSWVSVTTFKTVGNNRNISRAE